MRLLELGILCRDTEKVLQQLQSWKVIPTAPNYLCKKCDGPLKLGRSGRDSDGWRWFCSNYGRKNKKKRKLCGAQVSIRTGTFFSKSRLTIFQIFAFINLWLSNLSLVCITDALGITYKTSVDWAAFCREIVLWLIIESSEQLGGKGRTVEVNESSFEICADGKAMLSGYELETGNVFMVPIPDDSPESKISTIREWIAPGSTILIESGHFFDFRENECLKHLKTSFYVLFKDSGKARNMTGFRSYKLAGNIGRQLLIKRCELLKIDPIKEFLRLTGKIYNPATGF